jgi:peptidoglycan/xylan/chitin deacetylase (PgdA/CDA1 family)
MNDVVVLCYHAVSPTWQAALAVTPDALERQLSMFVERGYQGATFTDAVLRPPHRRTLAVTFDDGFLSVLERARPVLTRLGLVGTVFIPTAFMNRRQPLVWNGTGRWAGTPFADELEGMDWDDLRSLDALGWEVGSHTCTHPRLTQLDHDAAYTQLLESRLECARRLGAPCTAVAYPYGDVDQRVADAASEAGYAAAARLSSSLMPRGPLQWPRVGIYHSDAQWRFRLKASAATRRIRATRLWRAHEPRPVG